METVWKGKVRCLGTSATEPGLPVAVNMFFPYRPDTSHMEDVPVASSLIPEQRGLL